jgi:hypothetical protein
MRKLQIKMLADRVGGAPPVENVDPGTGEGGLCTNEGCHQTTNPFGGYIECCCIYACPSGRQWVCRTDYCGPPR